MYAVGIDSGTQGTKALVVEYETGAVRGRGRAPHAMVENPEPGASEQDPETWSDAAEKALLRALKAAGVNPKKVVSLGVSAQQHGFIPLDKRGHPIRPAKLWNDTSTVGETEAILEALGGKKNFIRKLGINVAVGFTASKILWLKNHEPANFGKLVTVLLPHNYLNFYLTGKAHMEYGDASGTGLMDIRKRVWHAEALKAIDPALARMLPIPSHPSEPVGYIKRNIGSKFGLEKVLVSSGGGDNMMGAVGTGNVVPGVCTLSLGTSGTVYSYFDAPFVDPEGEIAAFCDSTGGWLPLLCTMNVTLTTELFKALHGLSNEGLERLAEQAEPGSAGLLFLPFIDGERVPVLPEASGVFFGLNRRNFNVSAMARAVMEGAVLNLGYGFGRMKALGLKPAEIRATGGGAKSQAWLQMVADGFNTPVVTLKEPEAAAYGAALQSMWGYFLEKGETVSIREITESKVRLSRLAAEPDRRRLSIYKTLQERFNSLWKTLKSEFREHKKVTAGMPGKD